MNRLTQYNDLASEVTRNYEYDEAGNRTREQFLNGATYAYSYPQSPTNYRLYQVTDLRTYAYDPAGNAIGDGVDSRSFAYDGRGRLKQVVIGSANWLYQVNGLGQRVSKEKEGALNSAVHFVYDEGGRLIGEYDSAGDLISEVAFLGDTPVLQLSRSGNEVVVDNDTAGDVTSSTGEWNVSTMTSGYRGENYRRNDSGSGTFTWTPTIPLDQSYDVYARWTAASNHAQSVSYTVHYDGGVSAPLTVNQRQNGGEWVRLGTFAMTAGSQVVLDAAGAQGSWVVADAIKLAPNNMNNVTRYIHADHLDTPLRLMDANDAALWIWNPAPFGDTTPGGSMTFNHRFPGQYFDAETNLHYNYQRWYDPAIGRYIQSDPIGLEGGINTYAYVESNPLSYVDEDGLRRIPRYRPDPRNQKPDPKNPMNPGNCTKERHRTLQNWVNFWCKTTWVASQCFGIVKCIDARRKINLECYGGGNENHKKAILEKQAQLCNQRCFGGSACCD
jgi:RHS repeat-associated protein